MRLRKLKNKVAGWLGYVFCELSFRWINKVEIPYFEDWKWYHRLSYYVGEKLYSAGCYFYEIEMNNETEMS